MSVFRGAKKDALDEDSSSPLLLAAIWGRHNAIVALLKGGAQVSTTDNEGRSAVYWAAQNGHVEVLNVSPLITSFLHVISMIRHELDLATFNLRFV